MCNLRLLAVAIVLASRGCGAVQPVAYVADEPKLSQQEIEKIVRDYLLREPEVLAEAFRRLQQRQTAAAATKAKQAIQDNQQALLSDQASPVEGNAQGKVTIVEFFDYRCSALPPRRAHDRSDRELERVGARGLQELSRARRALGPRGSRRRRGAAAGRMAEAPPGDARLRGRLHGREHPRARRVGRSRLRQAEDGHDVAGHRQGPAGQHEPSRRRSGSTRRRAS